jgi:OFA family oxalate/formate antiporter-like MFS transporter
MALAATMHRPGSRRHPSNRWVQLVASVAAMMAIAAVVFVWPLLQGPPGKDLAESLAATQNAFAAFIIAETLFVPLEARIGDRFPRWLLVGVGVALVALGAFAGARAESVRALVAWHALGGVGAGLAYGGTVAKALKRFTERKALCFGVTAAACALVLALALGAILALSSERAMPVLVLLGAGQAAVILIATLLILDPPPARPPQDW